MSTRTLHFGGLLLLAAALLAAAEAHSFAAPQGKFDRLTDADRKALAERFQKDIWPLLERGGKDGCVGCHNGKRVTALRFNGDAAKDFPMLVGDGFLLKGDPGSLLERIVDKDKKRRMPPDNRPVWSDAEIKVLRDFVQELDRKNKL
jgi:hypothetical protein